MLRKTGAEIVFWLSLIGTMVTTLLLVYFIAKHLNVLFVCISLTFRFIGTFMVSIITMNLAEGYYDDDYYDSGFNRGD